MPSFFSWLFEVAFVQCMKDMVKVEFPSKKGPFTWKTWVVSPLSSEIFCCHEIWASSTWHLNRCRLAYWVGRLSTTALNIVSPSTYFERTSAVNTTLPDDAVQLHHCLSVVHHRVDGLGQSQIFEFDLTWISGEEVSAQGYAYLGMGI